MATTPAKRACSVCGTLLAADSPFCPVCALQQALGTQNYSDSNSYSELRFEHYTVLKNAEGKPLELGRGGMGVTYKAFDVHLQRPAALKIINAQLFSNESARARFIREARAAASVRHQNVASVFHIGESGGNYYYAMELVEGESLSALIRHSGCLGTDLALDIVEQAAAGLAAIEKQHLVHRDIKPSNIMVSLQDGKLENVKIIDLGLAKGVAEENSLSTVGAFVGTPTYASPEQFAGIATDIRSDLYSLGVTLWEMLSGKLPFSGSAAELMYQHQHAEPPIEKLRNVPAPVVALLQVLLAKDPNQRFQTPAQLQQALMKIRGASASGSRLTADELSKVSGPVSEHLSKGKPRKQTIRWLLGAGLCLATVLIAWFFSSGHFGLFNWRSTEAAPTEKSIAVLPFENISPNKEDAYFADGVQNEILNNLAKIAQLKVICRTSVMQYRGDNKRNLHEIAKDLGVANVLEGTVRRHGNHVRVSTELVDARNYNTIWADSYDRDLTDIFAIQSEIAQQVASRLSARLSPEEQKSIAEKPTDNLEAYDLYLQAKELVTDATIFYFKNPRESLLMAIRFLGDATRKDSHYALAYCLLAKAHDSLYGEGFDKTLERRALGDSAVNEALRVRPDLPEVHLAIAFHRLACYRDYERARVQIAIAQQSLPNSSAALAIAADLDRRQGRWAQSTAGLQKALTLDPRNPELLSELADNYFWLRRYQDYRNTYDRLIELQPDKPILILQKAFSALNGNADLTSYRAALEGLPSSMKDDTMVASSRWAYALSERDWATAGEILSSYSELYYFNADTAISRGCLEIWLTHIEGSRPTTEPRFAEARDQLNRKVEGQPEDASLLSTLAVIDAALDRKRQAIEEAKRAMEMLPVSADGVDGPALVYNLAAVYAAVNEPELAFQELSTSIKTPGGASYGALKLDPAWDPLRNDPRFDKLLAELAPRGPAENSIAVLPFESLSDNKSDAYFADGVQDEILNNLAKIAQLKVISRTSVMKYRAGTERDLRQIASALGVANVLEGTVRRDGNHIRVSTELVDARSDNTIWADSYDRDLTDIFEIQSDIAQAVASKLSARLSPEELKDIEEKPTTNLEAYDLYLKAKELIANSIFSGSMEEDLLKAISLAQEATKRDSKFALAFCQIAEAVDELYGNNIDQTPEKRELGDIAVNEALRLQPNLPEVHLTAAVHLYSWYRNYERARLHVAIAERMLPNNPEVLDLKANIDRQQGRWEESTTHLKEAVTLDPRNPELLNDLAINYEKLRRYRELEQTCDRLIQLEPDSHYLKVARAGDSLLWKADLAGYRASLENLPPSIKEDATFASLRIHAAALARDWNAAKEIISKSSKAEFYLFDETGLVPRKCLEIWLAALQGERPTIEAEFGSAYDQLKRKVEADPGNSPLLSALSLIDAALGRKPEAIQEATHAVEMLPISEDAFDGPMLVSNLAIVYAWTNELDLAFEKLTISATTPAGVHYGELKLDPAWDPLRKDPRFDKLLAKLAPRD